MTTAVGNVDSRLEVALLTFGETAAVLRVSIWTVRRLVAEGPLPVVRLGRAVRVRRADVDRLIDFLAGEAAS